MANREDVERKVDDMLENRIEVLSVKKNRYETQRRLDHWSIPVDEQMAWFAMHDLSGNGFKMWVWLYLTANAGKVSSYSYDWMDDRVALGANAYFEGFAELVDKGYLVDFDLWRRYVEKAGEEVPVENPGCRFVFVPDTVAHMVPDGVDGARYYD